MKRILVLLLVLAGFTAYGQTNNPNSFGLSAGSGYATVVRASLEGAPSLDLQNNFEFGASYYRQLGNRLKFETGLFYHYNKLIQQSAFAPDLPAVTTQYDIHLLYLPAFVRLNLSRHLFISGGALLDIDLSNPMGLSSSRALNNLSGLGAGIGIGGEIALFDRFYLQLSPYLNLHGAVLFAPETNPGRLLDAGIKAGIRTW